MTMWWNVAVLAMRLLCDGANSSLNSESNSVYLFVPVTSLMPVVAVARVIPYVCNLVVVSISNLFFKSTS